MHLLWKCIQNFNLSSSCVYIFRNIEEDLLQQRQENAENIGSTQNWQREWNDSVPNFQIFVGPESEDVADDDFFNMSHSLFHQMDEMMRAMLQGFGNFNIDDSIPGLQQFEGILHNVLYIQLYIYMASSSLFGICNNLFVKWLGWQYTVGLVRINMTRINAMHCD